MAHFDLPPKPDLLAARQQQQRVYRWLRRSLLALLTLWLVLTLWQAPIVHLGQAKTREMRGVWMTHLATTIMYYTTRLDDVVANLAKHRLNTLYPCVWSRGRTLQPSQVLQKATDSSSLLPLPDVLAALIKQAHRQQLRLIPWFEYGLMVPPDSAIAKQHPEWLTVTRTGAKSLSEDKQKRLLKLGQDAELDAGSDKQAWLNPVHPEVQQFLTNLITDVVRRYEVDGIQLDDHFGLPIDFGYDPYTVLQYRKEHKDAFPPNDPTEPEWVAWRAGKITQLMSKISKSVKKTRKHAIVSLSPNTPNFAYRKYLQDWATWVKQGLLDEVVVQVYRKDLSVLNSELYNGGFRNLQQHIPISIGLYTGPFLSPKPASTILKEVEAVRKASFKGVSFFCWETTFWLFKGSSNDQVKQAFLKLFSQPSKAPL